MLSGFPQLDSLLNNRKGVNKATQEQQPDQYQAMPTQQPRDMQVGQPQAESPYQPNAQPPAIPQSTTQPYQPLGQSKGSLSQALFNKQQQDANRGTFGAMAKRRRF
jgi:hypothetical protein